MRSLSRPHDSNVRSKDIAWEQARTMGPKIGGRGHRVASSNGVPYLNSKHYTSNNLLEEAIENYSTIDCIVGHGFPAYKFLLFLLPLEQY